MPPTTDELVAWLRDHGVLQDVEAVPHDAAWMSTNRVAAIASGTAQIDGAACALEVRIPRDFPARLPTVSVESASRWAELPHVDRNGVICYRDGDDALADPGRPADIVREATSFAVQTLREGISPRASLEYANEIVAYWRHSFPRGPTYISLVAPGDEPRLVTSFRDRRGVRMLAESQAVFDGFSSTRSARGQACNALYVPVDLTTGPVFHPKELATYAGFATHVLPVLQRHPKRWRRLCRRCRGTGIDVLVGVERPQGRRGVIGIRIESKGAVRTSTLEELRRCAFTPFHLDLGDPSFLLPRGGASDRLRGKRVLLAGCGSVGGHVAIGMARGGIGRLDLVDPDRFELANTHRHVCGRAYWRELKSDGLKKEIERLIPYVDVRSRPGDILELLHREPELMREIDLVVVAIGAPNIEHRINEAVLRMPGAPPVLFAWLEPLGIGGHVLAVNVAGRRQGCFECLYEVSEDIYSCRAAFAAPGGQYSRDTMGCGGRHVSFSDLDAGRLAACVVQRAIDVLEDRATGGLLSLKGSAAAFRDAGFETTRRYDEPGVELTLSSDDVVRPDCAVCGS